MGCRQRQTIISSVCDGVRAVPRHSAQCTCTYSSTVHVVPILSCSDARVESSFVSLLRFPVSMNVKEKEKGGNHRRFPFLFSTSRSSSNHEWAYLKGEAGIDRVNRPLRPGWFTSPRESQSSQCLLALISPSVRGMFRFQIFSQIPLCKKKIPRHIKMSAHAWSTKCK
jgi:hypothetical protein